MKDLKGKVVLITGASSGIGFACAKEFAALGCHLVLVARRSEKLQNVGDLLVREYGVKVHRITLDVRDYEAVEESLITLPEPFQNIEILVNNAGLARGLEKLHLGDLADWNEMIDTNVKGLLYVSKVVIPGMIARGAGHIINLGSIAGHEAYGNGAVYCATKHAVKAITESLRKDLVDTPLRVTTVDPGMVETEFSIVRFHGDTEKAANTYKGIDPLTGEDIADAIIYAATRPDRVSINEIILMPTHQASATVVHRKM